MKALIKYFSLLLLMLCASQALFAQKLPAQQVFYKLRAKLDAVKDYTADISMKIEVPFMRVPLLKGKLYFKAPGKMKLERNGGIAILPKKDVNLTLNNLVPSGDAAVIDAGYESINGKNARVLKVIPESENSGIVLTKIWVDEDKMLAVKTETTTRDNGTIKMELQYGKFVNLSLPDKVIFHVDVKEFKMPKGVAMDYDAGENDMTKKVQQGSGPKKGTIHITYLSYKVNTGLSDAVFADKKR